MGKKTRKTRWRALTITDEQSDSEASSNTSSSVTRLSNGYQHQKPYYNSYAYSSQSTPRRRYQHDSTKSTRSSSTTSENKITFNEDEYTRITTPRQDVLFKKGYLNKPKNYQTQNSTGTSTSTGNSTENGTPDHQSTDLDYESQFVFPNAFVDHNGIYYINSFDSYPVVVFNPPTYYSEFSDVKSKRYSTGSLTESMSPNNEEVTSQDLSQSSGETSNNISDCNNHMYNMIYPGYYVNGICPQQDVENEHNQPEVKKIKKKRRRKLSKSTTQDDTSENSDGNESANEVFHNNPVMVQQNHIENEKETLENNDRKLCVEKETNANNRILEDNTNSSSLQNSSSKEINETLDVTKNEEGTKENINKLQPKYDLKPDAEEFVPRNKYRSSHDHILNPNVQFVKVPPNYVPLPIINTLNDFNGQNYNHAFIPPGIPINFIPQDPKLFPSYVEYIPTNQNPEVNDHKSGHAVVKPDVTDVNVTSSAVEQKNETSSMTNNSETTTSFQTNNIDIAKIVSKLEKAAKDQDNTNPETSQQNSPNKKSKKYYEAKQLKRNERLRSNGYKPNYSSIHNHKSLEGNIEKSLLESPVNIRKENNTRNSDVMHSSRSTPERYKKNWVQSNYKSPGTNGVRRQSVNQNSLSNDVRFKQHNFRNYSETLKKIQNPTASEKTESKEKQIAIETSSTRINETSAVKPLSSKATNQWISVSSRKKRKNKSVEDPDDTVQLDKDIDQDEQFESYDVNTLEDVKLSNQPDKEEFIIIEQTSEQSNKIEDCNVNETSNSERLSIPNNTDGEHQNEPIEEKEQFTQITDSVDVLINRPDDKLKLKKKTKKCSQKLFIKRILITDKDMSVNDSEKKEEDLAPSKNVEILEENKSQMKIGKNDSAKVNQSPKKEIPETTEKKPKKKKKKSVKQSLENECSGDANSVVNTTDDSYDFLLEPTLLDESFEKTNVEISQELDKMIQKGMYTNLEEKIKSLNTNIRDGFFQTVMNNISSREPSIEKTNFIKSPDFSKIINPKQFLKSSGNSSVSVEDNNSKIQMDISKIKLPDLEQLSTASKSGFFLENPDVDEILQETNQNVFSNSEKIICNSKKISGNKEASNIESKEKVLYPITQAVKEWMSRTREATPEIELLKSPNTIYKEFSDVYDDSETDNTTISEIEEDQKNVNGNSLIATSLSTFESKGVAQSDQEIVIFTCKSVKNESRESSVEQDLLEFWENDIVSEKKVFNNLSISNQHDECACLVEEGEDILEVYESKYGKNEDFLKIQAEIENKNNTQTPTSSSYPRTANGLPYSRAICCSLM